MRIFKINKPILDNITKYNRVLRDYEVKRIYEIEKEGNRVIDMTRKEDLKDGETKFTVISGSKGVLS